MMPSPVILNTQERQQKEASEAVNEAAESALTHSIADAVGLNSEILETMKLIAEADRDQQNQAQSEVVISQPKEPFKRAQRKRQHQRGTQNEAN
jgi:hypothetical protein